MTRIALVTGGQQGIGLGISRALVGAGYRVALASQADAKAPGKLEAAHVQGLHPRTSGMRLFQRS